MNMKIAGLAAGVALGALGLGIALAASDADADAQVIDSYRASNLQPTDYCAHLRPDGGVWAEVWGSLPSDDAGTALSLSGQAGNGLAVSLRAGTATTIAGQINSAAAANVIIQSQPRFRDGGTP